MNPQVTARVIQIKADLLLAMKSGDKVVISALRSLLARISNAEAVQPTPAATTGAIARASVGVGSTEAQRRVLTAKDVQALINEELTELREALRAVGDQADYGKELTQKIHAISKYS